MDRTTDDCITVRVVGVLGGYIYHPSDGLSTMEEIKRHYGIPMSAINYRGRRAYYGDVPNEMNEDDIERDNYRMMRLGEVVFDIGGAR